MPSRRLPPRPPPAHSRSQLRAVFSACDPHRTGVVSLDRLLELARAYCPPDSSQEVERALRQLDPAGRGLLGFRDFCAGVSALLAGDEGRMVEPPSFLLTSHDDAPPLAVATPPASTDDADSALGGSTSPELNGKSQCSSLSDGESFECYGESGDIELDGEAPQAREGRRSPLARHTWLRTSLRRPNSSSNNENLPNRRWGSFRHTGRRLGSNALASQLYRSSSFNSSGRSSTCDTGDDMYSDVSLEEDVLDLNHKVQMLQQQVNVLADNQTNTDDRYTRAKQDSAALQARVLMLEEQVREAELRAEERLQEEQRRHRELMVRVEREKQLQVENCTIRLQTLELEAASLREEVTRLRAQTDRLRNEKQDMEEQLAEAQCAMSALREDAERLQEAERRLCEEAARESHANAQVVEELSRELEVLRQEQLERSEMGDTSRSLSHSQQEEELAQQLCELQAELSVLRQQNKSLQESNEELQAQMLTRSLEEGRTLLTNGAGAGNSLAAELEAMSQDELNADASDNLSLEQMRTALKEQQEVNAQLRTYIDGILLNIVENYPQLLEVKTH
ncbi:rab11 family-interacting protein 4 isoform X1 [Schistocerca nitens]|uniref:rab11 family-interacting protein 4 isoform X1 n=2 Tax=Schistocerca nitens TaxID=7011 RepID=UPI0021178266|nr:rab11 family-interacting protein 4 isoform X1 [Schistocerca nitens]